MKTEPRRSTIAHAIHPFALPCRWLYSGSPMHLNSLLFDMDGVLAEVSCSYRQAIVDVSNCTQFARLENRSAADSSSGSSSTPPPAHPIDTVVTDILRESKAGSCGQRDIAPRIFKHPPIRGEKG